MRTRPTHLRERPVTGFAFTESAVLWRRDPGSRNEFGEWARGTSRRITIAVATAPLDDEGANFRDIPTGNDLGQGVRRVDARKFWTIEADIRPVLHGSDQREADEIEYDELRYRVVSVARWGRITGVVGVLRDPWPQS